MAHIIEEYKAEIRRTFDLVKVIAPEASAIFYATLWDINPSTKSLFEKTDMVKQGEKLMATLGVAVAMLDCTPKLVPILRHLGQKHVTYGVKADMYPCVERALLLTLERGLGPECTPRSKAAWSWVLQGLSRICIDAAKEIDPNYGDYIGYDDEGAEVVPEGEDEVAPIATLLPLGESQRSLTEDQEEGKAEPGNGKRAGRGTGDGGHNANAFARVADDEEETSESFHCLLSCVRSVCKIF